ncbi:unnamed protein product [Clonostachys rosea]|uniref:Transcription factor domain-containing protein n=1 Tax=Bionectria ochroleuca TaxID=29856 RepID=A0ABY6U467_BIOOC|nr:unnamed protein product [Clonostachys rosea]
MVVSGVVLSIESFVHMGISDHDTARGAALLPDHSTKTQHEHSEIPESKEQGSSSQTDDMLTEPMHTQGPLGQSQTMGEVKEFNMWPMVGRSSVSAEEIPLLQSFIHTVAPSLDIYDIKNTFRHNLTALAMNCPCLLEKLLRLSAALTDRPTDLVKTRGAVSFRLRADNISPLTAVRLMASFALDRALLFAEDSLDEWESGFYRDHIPPIITATHHMDAAEKRIWCSILALVARLEIAASLAHGNSSMTSASLLDRIHDYQSRSVDPFCACFDAAMNCLKLLSEVMDLCLPAPYTKADRLSDESSYSANDPIFASRWNKLLRKLLAWEKARPVELEEILMIDGSENTLPQIIYSGGGGISTNILYHTAMFLLLNKKPQSIGGSERDQNAVEDEEYMNPLFHLRWVGGISLHCEVRDSHFWDPCTLAAMSVLTPHITGLIQPTDMASSKK